MSRMQREKGKRGEREVVALARAMGYEAWRTWETAQGRGDSRCDVVIKAASVECPFQVKLRKRGFQMLYDALEGVQAVFIRQNGKPWLVVVPAENYLRSIDNLRGASPV